jgi:hypothetical protein
MVTSAKIKGGASILLSSTSQIVSWENRGNSQTGVRDTRNREAPFCLAPGHNWRSHRRRIKGGASTSLGFTSEIAEIEKRLFDRRLVTVMITSLGFTSEIAEIEKRLFDRHLVTAMIT